MIGGGDHTVALLTAHATRGGQTLDYKVAEVYHIRDGKISRVTTYYNLTDWLTQVVG